MANNSLVKRINEIKQQYFSAGLETGVQMTADYLQLVLRDPEVMGKDIFGRERIERVLKAIREKDREYNDAYDCKNIEADYLREKLDRELREIWGDDLVPFAERQENIKTIDYSRPMKHWKE